MRLQRVMRILGGAIMAIALLIGQPRAQAQSQDPFWSRVEGINSNAQLKDVFMVDQTNAWAVGMLLDGSSSGIVYQLRLVGGRWQATPGPSYVGTPLNAVAATSVENVWAVGENGTIIHRIGGGRGIGWMSEQPLPGTSLKTIQILGSGEQIWVGGMYPKGDGPEAVMLKYQAGSWSRDTSVGGAGQIASLHFAPGGGWAVGGEDIWRYDGGTWKKQEAPEPCGEPGCGANLNSVRAVSADEVWVVGTRSGYCAICVPHPYAIHRDGGSWAHELPEKDIFGWNPDPSLPAPAFLGRIFFTSHDTAFAVGSWIDRTGNVGPRPLIARYQSGTWTYQEPGIVHGILNAVSMADDTHGLAVGEGGLLLAYGYGEQSATAGGVVPTTRVPNPQQPGVLYFDETGHTLRGEFLNYWRANGGLAQFGYPKTEEYRERNPDDGKEYLVQYFERARFEYHPELAGTRYAVLLGLLGRTVTAGREGEAAFVSTGDAGVPGGRYFAETGHNMAPQFIRYWERTGGLAVYGFPVSEAFYEKSPTDGQTYLVQYFERNRFEYHPEQRGTPYEVLLGLLGNEILRGRGWLP